MSPFDAALWAAVVVLALAAGWLTLPRPPLLDWERLFKLAIVTFARGEVERAGGAAEAWLSAGRGMAWYHPAGRDATMKLLDPAGYSVAVPALPGERALMEELAATSDPADRLRRMFSGGADALLYEDPAELGPAWDLAVMLGQGADWDALAALSDPWREAIRRRNDRRRWVIVADPEREDALEGLRAGLAAALGDEQVALVREADAEALARRIDALIPEIADRLVLVAVGRGAELALRVLRKEQGQRDRVLAVVTLSAALDQPWLEAEFTHLGFDTELNRQTPYFYLAFVDPSCEELGEAGRPARFARVPSPPVPASGRVAIEAIDLGLLPGPLAAARQDALAAALLVTVSVRLAG